MNNWYKKAMGDMGDMYRSLRKHKEEEHDIRKDKFRYCPVCGEFYQMQCRCSGPHSLEDLKKGHGFSCKNGHRWSGEIVYNPEG